jgi:hypothetical protein
MDQEFSVKGEVLPSAGCLLEGSRAERGRLGSATVAALLGVLALSGCASKSGSAVQARADGPSSAGSAGASAIATDGGPGSGLTLNVDGGTQSADGGVGAISIVPANPVLTVTVTNGVVTAVTGGSDAKGTLSFQATSGGVPVTAKWSIDRGELGTLNVATGAFVPAGTYSGVGTVSAYFGSAVASSTVTVNLQVVQNGGAWNPATAVPGVGGVGGVGGDPPGAAVDDKTRTLLSGTATAPGSAAELGLLYPYDGTVWPRGLFAPLLQWQTTHTASAVLIHLSQKNFDFQGFYAGTNLVTEHIDQTAWAAAANGNSGDSLHVEVRITDGTTTYGPVAEDWTIAPGILKGTVYYNSYSTTLATTIPDGRNPAAVLAIKPGTSDPVLAIPAAKDKCVVCHTVSDDGSTLFAQNGKEPGDDYSEGESYDLTKNGAVIQSYLGNASDNTTNNRKFVFSGLSKDGTYALQSSGHTQEHYSGPSAIFRRDNGNQAPATGFDGQITEAVTPAFSRDGKQVAFNYWTGTLAPGGGAGHTLDLMDFACGAPASVAAGAPSCATFGFSNLRHVFTSPDTGNNGIVGWPAWLPDSSGIVFQNTTTNTGSPLSTFQGNKAQLWFVGLTGSGVTAPQAVRLDALNGDDSMGNSILPVATGVTLHGDDDHMNYEPTVNPIVSGGYAWVVFTTRRMYGNLAQGDPYESSSGTHPIPKKLWVAAIDLKWTPGKDPSHPAFYLPGQELDAGNMRGFWVVDPCRADGASCDTGDECCDGYCRPDETTAALVCGGKPSGCANEFERCTEDSDCCATAGAGVQCINGFCASQPVVK